MKLTDRELGAVLAGLRLYRGRRQLREIQGFDHAFDSIEDIASNNRELERLSLDEIEELCERLNTND